MLEALISKFAQIEDPDPCMGLLKSIADVYACWYFSVLS